MLSERGLVDLRRAATLAHRYPTLRARVGQNGETLLEVTGHPDPAPTGAVRTSPCAFRSAVVSAWSQHRSGRRMRLLDLTEDPQIEIRTVAGGAILPGDVVRTPLIDKHSYLLTTTVDFDTCSEDRRPCFERVSSLPQVSAIGWFRDPETEISVIHVDVGPELGEHDEEPLVDALQDLAACLLTTELLIEVGAEVQI